MAKIVRINFSENSSAADTNGTWSNLINEALSSTAVLYNFADGVDTGWDITVTDAPTNNGSTGENAVGTGDADWVDEAIVSLHYHFAGSGAPGEYEITGLDNAKTYNIEIFGSRDSGTSSISEYSADNYSSSVTLESSHNSSNTVTISGISPASGIITLYFRENTGSTWGFINAVEITEVDGTASVDDVNTDEIINDAETGNTLTVSGYAGDITGLKLISGTAESTMLSLAGTGDNYTFNNVDVAAFVVDTVGALLTSASHVVQIQATDGTDTEVLTVNSIPKAGWEVKEVTNVVNDTGSFSVSFTGVVSDTCQAYYPTANNTSISEGGTKLTITGATQANPVVLSVVNSYVGGETVAIKSITGMVELNERLFKVANPTGTTIELLQMDSTNEDGTGHTAYSSGGTVGIAGGIVSTDSTTDIDMQFLDVDDDKIKPFTLLLSTDTTPDAFSFTDLTGQLTSTLIASSIETITGIDASTAISVDTGEYRMDSGSWVTAPGTITNNQTVQLRHTSSASNLTTTSQVLTVGGVTDQWDVTTIDPDTTPEAFVFTDLVDQLLSTVLESSIETITGINASTPISISTTDGMEYRINGGTYKSTADNLVVDDTVQLRVTSSISYGTTVSGILTIGGVTDQWDVTTEVEDVAGESLYREVVRPIVNTVVKSVIR